MGHIYITVSFKNKLQKIYVEIIFYFYCSLNEDFSYFLSFSQNVRAYTANERMFCFYS